jgi:hypothetical protein
VVKLSILWRWLKRSGLDYTEEFNEYEREMKKRYGGELAVNDICLAGTTAPTDTKEVILYAAKSCDTSE